MSLLTKLRNILIILKLFYWFAFKATVKAISIKNLRRAHQFWAEICLEYFKVSLNKLEGSKQMRREKTLILANHRTQADFFVHSVIAEHQSNFLSRLMVGVIFFIFYFSAKHTVWFFNRSGNIDPEKFNSWLDTKFQKSPRPLLLAYPEGHRMGSVTSVNKEKLKTGMIRYGYRRAIPVQLLMSFGNQKIFNEKKLAMSWNQKVYYSFSKIYNPSDYENENQFVAVIKDEFSDFFDTIYQQYAAKMAIEQGQNQRKRE